MGSLNHFLWRDFVNKQLLRGSYKDFYWPPKFVTKEYCRYVLHDFINILNYIVLLLLTNSL